MQEIVEIIILLSIVLFPITIAIITAIISGIYNSTKRVVTRKANKKVELLVNEKKEQAFAVLDKEINSKQNTIANLDHEIELRQNQVTNIAKQFEAIKESTSQEYPFLANTIAEFYYAIDVKLANDLLKKKRPAIATASEIKNIIAQEKREEKNYRIELQNQIEFYEFIFPWLEDFKEMSPEDAIHNAEQFYIVQNRRAKDFQIKKIQEKFEREKEKDRINYLEKKKRAFTELDFQIKTKKDKITQLEKQYEEIKNSMSQQYPFLAESIAELCYSMDLEIADFLETKKNPALQTAKDIKENIAQEKKTEKYHRIILQNQLSFYESMFPWLDDFKELPPDKAMVIMEETKSISEDDYDNYDHWHEWLSPEEYSKLSNTEKCQLALDRWKRRKQSNWDIGIDYERYIGYLKEKNGFKVKYQGATMKLEDMGIDLLARKENTLQIIQCKRWNEHRTIHEKHVFQLYGTMVLKEIEFPEYDIFGYLIVSEDNVSDLAKQCADYLGIKIETIPYEEYPLIKCNINNGEKIYHLPMDQQYYRTIIDFNHGEFYAWTVDEAENAGFRHARRHIQ